MLPGPLTIKGPAKIFSPRCPACASAAKAYDTWQRPLTRIKRYDPDPKERPIRRLL